MKKILLILLTIFSVACGKNEEIKNETPEALQESSKISTRYSGRTDLVDEIYGELVSKSPDLQKLESEIEALDTQGPKNQFEEFNNKSANFYASVDGHARSITDSILKNKMLEIIKSSNAKNSIRSEEYKRLTKMIDGIISRLMIITSH